MKKTNTPQPVKRPTGLGPIKVAVPPKNTQIMPRCFMCDHFEVCKYRSDYLKTITVLQQGLGDPLVALEIKPEQKIPAFKGVTIVPWRKYFPVKITLVDYDEPLAYNMAKFQSLNEVHILYQTPKNFILLRFLYKEDSFELDYCRDAFYQSIDYEINEDDATRLKDGLLQWRTDQMDQKVEPLFPPVKDREVVDTTHFSASLDCDLYAWNGKDFKTAVEEYAAKYPDGIPMGDDVYHIATFHVDNHKIPFSPLYPDVVESPKVLPKRKDLQ